MAPADNMPDFENMSFEEQMRWLESLAKRQGADAEELLTTADMDVQEIDPDSVVLDEPGYIPYGEDKPVEFNQPARATTPEPPPQEPITPPSAPVVTTPEPVAEQEGSLAWLESLAANQSENDALFNLDIGSLVDEPQTSEPAVDPVSWLEDLARSQGEIESSAPQTQESARDDDAMRWLESLAKRQGADSEELLTEADIPIEDVDSREVELPNYTPFGFDTPPITRSHVTSETPSARSTTPTPEPDPTEWLQSLAAEQGIDEDGVTATRRPDPVVEPETEAIGDIEKALLSGEVTPEQMQVWMEHQMERGLERTDVPDYIETDEQAEATADEDQLLEAEIPDWLLEVSGGPPSIEAEAETDNRPSLESLFGETPVDTALPTAQELTSDIPNWLLEGDEPDQLAIDDIFAELSDEHTPSETDHELEIAEIAPIDLDIDVDDPWVEAFELEYGQELPQGTDIPEWYERNLNDPNRIAAIETPSAEEFTAPPLDLFAEIQGLSMPTSTLPEETNLTAGVEQAIPDWLSELHTTTASAESIGVAEPELLDADAINDDEFPDWLKEIQESESEPTWLAEPAVEEAVSFVVETPAEQPTAPPPATTPPPAPKPQHSGDWSLETARSKAQAGEVDLSLNDYDQLVRANQNLDEAVEDLSTLVKLHRNNPIVYRVLGDGLMKQGKLQAALDTYRAALNQL